MSSAIGSSRATVRHHRARGSVSTIEAAGSSKM
jgi:hypothetical protein